MDFECDIHLAPWKTLPARYDILDIDLVVHDCLVYYSPHDLYEESPLRRVEGVNGSVVGYGKGYLAPGSVPGVRDTD